jgi:hypothetical protein
VSETITVQVTEDAQGNRAHRLVGDWPDNLLVSDDLLRDANPSVMRREGAKLRFTLANGDATYSAVSPQPNDRPLGTTAWRKISASKTNSDV